MRWPARLLALAAAAMLVMTAACNRNGDDDPEPTVEDTAEPTAEPQTAGEFQLVARVEHAFVDVDPDIDLDQLRDPLEEGTGGREAAGINGVLRGELEAFSDNLRDRCDADEGDRFNVYWRATTLFDPDVAGRNLEAALDGERVGILGTIHLRSDADADLNLDTGTASPDASPTAAADDDDDIGATDEEGEQDCVLIAEQVGASEGALPTARPAPGRTRTTPTPAVTQTPGRTPTPTPTRTRTPSPSPAPTDTEEPTDIPDPSPDSA